MLKYLIALTLAASAQAAEPQKFPDVLHARVQAQGENRFDFDVTLSSPYDTPQRYADAFRVTGPEGAVYGERKLVHDHQDEQPFTRDLYGVSIPQNISTVTIQGHDQRSGYGGKTLQVKLPGR